MEDIFNFFVVFYKNLLKDVHKSIMREFGVENNPNPSRLRGRGVEVSKTLFYVIGNFSMPKEFGEGELFFEVQEIPRYLRNLRIAQESHHTESLHQNGKRRGVRTKYKIAVDVRVICAQLGLYK